MPRAVPTELKKILQSRAFHAAQLLRIAHDGGTTGVELRLHRRTRMLYDQRHIYINGESFLTSGRDARLLRGLSDRRALSAAEVTRLSAQARTTLDEWAAAGWLEGGWA